MGGVPGGPGGAGRSTQFNERIEPSGAISNQRLATTPVTRGGAPVESEEWPGPVSVLRCR
jgi:hypothetical protein